jgi:carbon storage regulator
MLVLSRKRGEEITIGDNIRIVVVALSPFVVQIGIDAPRDVRIERDDRHDVRAHKADHNSKITPAEALGAGIPRPGGTRHEWRKPQ